MRRAVLLIGLLLPLAPLHAKSGGTATAEFTKFGMGARFLAMGGAAVSVADDASAVYWNPANLSRLQTPDVTMMRADMLEGYYNSLAYAQPMGLSGVWAGALQTASAGSLGVTDETGL